MATQYHFGNFILLSPHLQLVDEVVFGGFHVGNGRRGRGGRGGGGKPLETGGEAKAGKIHCENAGGEAVRKGRDHTGEVTDAVAIPMEQDEGDFRCG